MRVRSEQLTGVNIRVHSPTTKHRNVTAVLVRAIFTACITNVACYCVASFIAWLLFIIIITVIGFVSQLQQIFKHTQDWLTDKEKNEIKH